MRKSAADDTDATAAKITGTNGDAGTDTNPSSSSEDEGDEGDDTSVVDDVEDGEDRADDPKDEDDREDDAAEPEPEPEAAVEVPAEVRRYVLRPLLWMPWAFVLGLLGYAMQLDNVQADEWVYGDGEPLTAVVAEPYDEDGFLVPLVYEHPVAGPTSVAIPIPDGGNPPQPGQTIAIRAHQTYPGEVRLAADPPDPAQWWTPLVVGALVLLVVARRWWSVRRTVRAAGTVDDDGPVEMIGKLRDRRRRGRTTLLDLYSADNPTKLPKRPSITVPLVSTLGLPVGGRTFKVKVHGRANRFGRVVGEVADGLLWPRRRGLLRQRVPGDLDSVADRPSRALPIPSLETRKLKAPKQLWPEERLRSLGAVALLAGAVLVGVLATMANLSARDDARVLPDGSRLASARVTGFTDAGMLEVAYLPPGDPDGDPVAATVGPDPVTNPGAWPTGQPLVVVVQADGDARVTLPPEPYRAAAPIVGGWLPAMVAGAWLVRIRDWRRQRQAANESGATWYPVEVRWMKDPLVAEVRRPRAKAASCVVTLPWGIEEVPKETTDKLVNRGQQVYAHMPPEPGRKLVLRTAGRAYATVTPATLRDQRWRRRWRFVGKRGPR